MGKVICRLLGRLGNQLFEIAAAKKYAKDNGLEFIGAWMYETPQWLQERDTPSDYIKQTVLRNVKFVTDDYVKENNFILYPSIGNDHAYLNSDFNIPKVENLCLSDFFQDSKYIDKEIAIELFKPYDSIKNEIQELYGNLDDYVCVNVRRGDYLRQDLAQLGFATYSKNDIETILNTYFPNDKVLFVSDDIEWCRTNFVGDRLSFVDKKCNNKIEMDLYIQTQCGKGNVVSNSSFSWWGAFLNEKSEKVVCPYPWFTNNFLNGFNQIIPDTWIKYKR